MQSRHCFDVLQSSHLVGDNPEQSPEFMNADRLLRLFQSFNFFGPVTFSIAVSRCTIFFILVHMELRVQVALSRRIAMSFRAADLGLNLLPDGRQVSYWRSGLHRSLLSLNSKAMKHSGQGCTSKSQLIKHERRILVLWLILLNLKRQSNHQTQNDSLKMGKIRQLSEYKETSLKIQQLLFVQEVSVTIV